MVQQHRWSFYRKYGKQALDLVLTLSAAPILAPIAATVAILVRVKLGSPVLFRQQRPGLDGKPFTMYKFRTMTDARNPEGQLLPDEQRLTSFGKLLRSTSLDELPEFLNVVKGDMSLIGPRPLLMKYLERYDSEQMRRHEVRPGITGWAQVNGRNAIDWPAKFQYDVWYVDHLSLALDFRILLLTVRNLVTRSGINQSGHATVEEFRGSSNTLTAGQIESDLKTNHSQLS